MLPWAPGFSLASPLPGSWRLAELIPRVVSGPGSGSRAGAGEAWFLPAREHPGWHALAPGSGPCLSALGCVTSGQACTLSEQLV